MANRADEGLRQARADLKHAGDAIVTGSFEWSCFAAQQAAEKAAKAAFLHLGMEAWGHTVLGLMQELASHLEVSEDLIHAAKLLDKHYIPTRYPNGFDSGAPIDYYTREEAEAALRHAQRIIEFCSGLLG